MGKFNFYCLITCRKISEFIFFKIFRVASYNTKKQFSTQNIRTVNIFPIMLSPIRKAWWRRTRLEHMLNVFASIGVRANATLLQIVLSFRGCSQRWFRREFIKINILLIFSHWPRIAFGWQHLVTIRIVVSALMECVAKILFHPFRRNSLAHIGWIELTWRNICVTFPIQ